MKKIIAILLAYLYLQGNVGLSLVKHYCGEMLALQNIGLFTAKVSCGMERESKPLRQEASGCEKPKEIKKSDCCHNKVEHLQVDDSLKAPSLASVDFVPLVLFLISFAFSGFRLPNITDEVALSGFSPPHRFNHRRFRAFLQVFRH